MVCLGRAAGAVELHVPSPVWSPKCLAHAGLREEAVAELDRLLDPQGVLARDDAPAGRLGLLLEAAVILDHRRHVADLLPRLANITATALAGPGVAVHNVARHLAAGAMLLGDATAARTYCARALNWATKIGQRPETALSRLQMAELLLDSSPEHLAEAQRHLDFAIEEFRAMKMQPSLERALRHKGLLHA